jgi:hypothetical protein
MHTKRPELTVPLSSSTTLGKVHGDGLYRRGEGEYDEWHNKSKAEETLFPSK